MAFVEFERNIVLHGANLSYVLRKSRRARNLRISIESDGKCVVTSPYYLRESIAEQFLFKKSSWVLSVLDRFRKAGFPKPFKISRKDIARYKIEARKVAHERLAYFNAFYNFRYGKIQIRNQKTRWGSCSKKGNINFNYKIALLPERERDYIIVHELCHVGEFNHSKKFWALVERTIPEYRDIRKKLRSGMSL